MPRVQEIGFKSTMTLPDQDSIVTERVQLCGLNNYLHSHFHDIQITNMLQVQNAYS